MFYNFKKRKAEINCLFQPSFYNTPEHPSSFLMQNDAISQQAAEFLADFQYPYSRR